MANDLYIRTLVYFLQREAQAEAVGQCHVRIVAHTLAYLEHDRYDRRAFTYKHVPSHRFMPDSMRRDS